MSAQTVVIEANNQDLMNAIGSLRWEVWQQETGVASQLFPEGIWIDALDRTSKHFIVIDQGEIAAAARVSLHETATDLPDLESYAPMLESLVFPLASLNRIVVKPKFRGRGFGHMLIEARLQSIHQQAASIVSIARGSQANRLERYGFVRKGTIIKSCPLTQSFPEPSEIMFKDLRTAGLSTISNLPFQPRHRA